MQPPYIPTVAFALAIYCHCIYFDKIWYHILVMLGIGLEDIIMSKKHMTLEDRYTIYHMLNDGDSFKKIADAIHKNCTSVSREIKNHLVFKKTGAYSQCH